MEYTKLNAEILEKIKAIVGEKQVLTDEDLIHQEIALYKVATEKLMAMGSIESLIRQYNIKILDMNDTFVVFLKSGHYAETQQLFEELSNTIGVLQFVRSGRIAITKAKVERLSDMLDAMRKIDENPVDN